MKTTKNNQNSLMTVMYSIQQYVVPTSLSQPLLETSIVGLSEAEVADRLGDTVAVTSKTYAKFFNQARVRAANKISSHKLGF